MQQQSGAKSSAVGKERERGLSVRLRTEDLEENTAAEQIRRQESSTQQRTRSPAASQPLKRSGSQKQTSLGPTWLRQCLRPDQVSMIGKSRHTEASFLRTILGVTGGHTMGE